MTHIKNERHTDVTAFFDELGAGVVKEQLGVLLSEAALAQINNGAKSKKAKITIELSLTQFSNNQQILVDHKITHKTPTANGDKSENTSSQSHFFVGKYGKLTIDQPKEDDNGQFSLAEQLDGIEKKSPLRKIAKD